MNNKLLKYVGGKSNVLDQVMARMFPEGAQYNRYIEPMCGSAVVGLHVAELGRAKVHLADANLRLVTMLRVVRDHPAVLDTVVSGMAKQYDAAEDAKQQVYYRWRNELNAQCSEVKTAALMLLLNRTGFNGLWRVNAKGQYNVSWGQRETCSYDVIHSAIFEASKALQGAQIAGGDFARIYTPEFGDLWYFDPPYDGTFDSYGSWAGETDLRRLAIFSREAVKKGAKVFVSNSETPLVRQVFEGCVLHAIEGRTCVSQTTEGRGMTKELLVEVRA